MTTRTIERTRWGIENITGEVVTWHNGTDHYATVAEVAFHDGYRSGWFLHMTDGQQVNSGVCRVVEHDPYDSHCRCRTCSSRKPVVRRHRKGSY